MWCVSGSFVFLYLFCHVQISMFKCKMKFDTSKEILLRGAGLFRYWLSLLGCWILSSCPSYWAVYLSSKNYKELQRHFVSTVFDSIWQNTTWNTETLFWNSCHHICSWLILISNISIQYTPTTLALVSRNDSCSCCGPFLWKQYVKNTLQKCLQIRWDFFSCIFF